MNKYSVFLLATVVIFVALFFTMLNGISLGKPYFLSMFVFSLLGIILGFKAKKGFLKWLLIILNIIAICVIGYITLLAYSIAES